MRFIIIIAALMGAACSLVFPGEVRITAINVESDTAKAVTGVQAQQIFSASQHTTRTDNPHAVTALQIGAVTAESDPLAGPRLALVEAETNKWRAAYGWGDHAIAGYLPAALWQSWLSTNTYVKVEQDPVASGALATHSGRTDNPHTVTASQVGAVTGADLNSALGSYLTGTTWDAWVSTNRVKKVWDRYSESTFCTMEYGTTIVWKVSGPFSGLSVALSPDFMELFGYTRPEWTTHAFPFSDGHWEGGSNDGSFYITYMPADGGFRSEDLVTPATLNPVQTGSFQGSAVVSEQFYYVTNEVRRLAGEDQLSEAKTEICVGASNLVTDATNALTRSSSATLYGSLTATNQPGFASFAEVNPPQTYMLLGAGTGASTNTAYFQWPVSGGRVLSASTVAYLSPGSLGVLAMSTLSVYDGSGILLTSNVMSTTITAWGELPFLTNVLANASVPSNGTIRLSVTVIKAAGQSGARLYVGGVTPLPLDVTQTTSFFSTAQENEALRSRTSHVLAQWYDDTGVVTQQVLRVGDQIVTNRWGPTIKNAITNGMLDVSLGVSNFSSPSNAQTRSVLFHTSDLFGDYAQTKLMGATVDGMTLVFPSNYYANIAGRRVYTDRQIIDLSTMPNSYVGVKLDSFGIYHVVDFTAGWGGTWPVLTGEAWVFAVSTTASAINNLGVWTALPTLPRYLATGISPDNLWSGAPEQDGLKWNYDVEGRTLIRSFGGLRVRLNHYNPSEKDVFLTYYGNASLWINAVQPDYSPLCLRGISGQTADLMLATKSNGEIAYRLSPNGDVSAAGTNTAAVLRSTGGYIIGPTISGKQAHIFTDGTNCFFVNVNNVTNALTTN